MRLLGLALVSSLLLPSLASAADGRSRAGARPRATRQAQASALAQAERAGLDRRTIGRLAHEVNELHRDAVSARARFFEKITVGRDYRGEHVLMRDNDVTAFLDMTDPQHPRFDPEVSSDEDLEAIPVAQRAHILVVPNVPRQHIARTFASRVRSTDLELTLQVTKTAERLARDLGLRNAQIFLNPADQVMIGYLHVHIIGERDPTRPYPQLAR